MNAKVILGGGLFPNTPYKTRLVVEPEVQDLLETAVLTLPCEPKIGMLIHLMDFRQEIGFKDKHIEVLEEYGEPFRVVEDISIHNGFVKLWLSEEKTNKP